MCEYCGQIEAEVVSNSRNKIHQTWDPPLCQSCMYMCTYWKILSVNQQRDARAISYYSYQGRVNISELYWSDKPTTKSGPRKVTGSIARPKYEHFGSHVAATGHSQGRGPTSDGIVNQVSVQCSLVSSNQYYFQALSHRASINFNYFLELMQSCKDIQCQKVKSWLAQVCDSATKVIHIEREVCL